MPTLGNHNTVVPRPDPHRGDTVRRLVTSTRMKFWWPGASGHLPSTSNYLDRSYVMGLLARRVVESLQQTASKEPPAAPVLL